MNKTKMESDEKDNPQLSVKEKILNDKVAEEMKLSSGHCLMCEWG